MCKKEDGTWEGDYELLGWGTFGELQDLIFSLKRPLVTFLSYREDEYDIEISDGPPPYSAHVAESLTSDLEQWSQWMGPELLEALREVSEEETVYGPDRDPPVAG